MSLGLGEEVVYIGFGGYDRELRFYFKGECVS